MPEHASSEQSSTHEDRLLDAFRRLTEEERLLLTSALAGQHPDRLAGLRVPIIKALAWADFGKVVADGGQGADQASPFTEDLVLRLAFAAETLASVGVDEDTGELSEDAGGLLSALDYALRGAPGCVEPEEWQEQRRRALAKHGDYLGLDWRS